MRLKVVFDQRPGAVFQPGHIPGRETSSGQRRTPYPPGKRYRHIGIYAYRTAFRTNIHVWRRPPEQLEHTGTAAGPCITAVGIHHAVVASERVPGGVRPTSMRSALMHVPEKRVFAVLANTLGPAVPGCAWCGVSSAGSGSAGLADWPWLAVPLERAHVVFARRRSASCWPRHPRYRSSRESLVTCQLRWRWVRTGTVCPVVAAARVLRAGKPVGRYRHRRRAYPEYGAYGSSLRPLYAGCIVSRWQRGRSAPCSVRACGFGYRDSVFSTSGAIGL